MRSNLSKLASLSKRTAKFVTIFMTRFIATFTSTFAATLTVTLTATVILFSAQAHAEILFEGYYKVTQFKKHIGFLVLRHELDAKTKQFKTTSFSKLAKNGFDMTESYQAVSDSNLAPVSLNYLAAGDKTKTKTIEVTVKKGLMTGTATENGKKIKIEQKIDQNVIWSSALYYLLLNNKTGLKTGLNSDFSAITEEGPVVMPGQVSIEPKMVTQGTLQLFKVKTKFAGPEYENLITQKGEVVSANTPATGIETELVKSSDEATEGIKMTSGTLEKIFGDVPAGKINVYQPKK